MTLDLEKVRNEFSALSRPVLFLDNPGGTQITTRSLDRILNYLIHTNANHNGSFETSRLSDQLVDEARTTAAEFLNAASASEIVFGPNMTSLTFNISRSLGRMLKTDDTIVVTRLDHDANISPWLLLAQDCGCKIRWVDFRPDDCTIDFEDFERAMEERPRLVAFGYASNAVGTINPVVEMVKLAHSAGALVYIDAVQYAPHGPIDVQAIDCDFLVCSAYKFFGPHEGVLYGRYDLLEELQAYRVRPAPLLPPGKFETGTGNFENIAGTLGALEYLEWIGETFGAEFRENTREFSGRRRVFKQAMNAIRAYEYEVNREFIQQLEGVKGIHVFGITDRSQLDRRVPTFSFTIDDWKPQALAAALDRRKIYTWDGNFYVLAITERLGLEETGGLLRSGAVHYNTLEEIRRFGEVLRKLAEKR